MLKTDTMPLVVLCSWPGKALFHLLDNGNGEAQNACFAKLVARMLAHDIVCHVSDKWQRTRGFVIFFRLVLTGPIIASVSAQGTKRVPPLLGCLR